MNPETRFIQINRDVIWIKQMMFQKGVDKDTAICWFE